MTLTDELCRSFFDLWHHLDPTAAVRFDPDGPPPALASFDRRTVRQHVAALRALGGAAEALEPATLDEEIDQTLLLDAIRGVEHEFTRELGRLADPAFWAHRLCETLAARPGADPVLAAIPGWADAAAASLTRPPVFGLETGLALLEAALGMLDQAAWAARGGESLGRARAALQGLVRTLGDVMPDLAPGGGTIGPAAVDWRLHYGFALNLGAAEALRALARLATEPGLVAGPAAGKEVALAAATPEPAAAARPPLPWSPFRDLVGPGVFAQVSPAGTLGPSQLQLASARPDADAPILAARYGPEGAGGFLEGRASAGSEIRRRFARPGLVEAWALYAEAVAARSAAPDLAARLRADLEARVVVAATDLAVHSRQLAPSDAASRLAERLGMSRSAALAEIRGIMLRPLEAAGSVLVWREWESLAGRWPEGPAAMSRLARREGLASPTLLSWRHGVDG